MERKAYVSESNDCLAFTPSPTANGRREILLTLVIDRASMSEDSTLGVRVSKAMMILYVQSECLHHEKVVFGSQPEREIDHFSLPLKRSLAHAVRSVLLILSPLHSEGFSDI